MWRGVVRAKIGLLVFVILSCLIGGGVVLDSHFTGPLAVLVFLLCAIGIGAIVWSVERYRQKAR